MSEPSTMEWSPEPWHATLNGTIYCGDGPIGDMDDPAKPDPSYASDRDVANAARSVACVNALAGLPAPHALPEVLTAVESLRDAVRGALIHVKSEDAAILRDRLNDLDVAVRRLRGAPES